MPLSWMNDDEYELSLSILFWVHSLKISYFLASYKVIHLTVSDGRYKYKLDIAKLSSVG